MPPNFGNRAVIEASSQVRVTIGAREFI